MVKPQNTSSTTTTTKTKQICKPSSVQSLSRVWLFETPWITACQASLSITNSRSLLKLMSFESVMPSSHLILCRPLLLLVERSYPTPEVRGSGQEEQPRVQGTLAVQLQEGLEELLHIQGQEGWHEEIPLIQGKEQRLCFAGAAMKRYPTSKVREIQVRG